MAASYSNLGIAWDKKREHDKAIGYYELALATMKNVLGDHHPTTQGVQINLERAQSKRDQ